jgi:hypothetical protein
MLVRHFRLSGYKLWLQTYNDAICVSGEAADSQNVGYVPFLALELPNQSLLQIWAPRLDNASSLLSGIPAYIIQRLQRAQN